MKARRPHHLPNPHRLGKEPVLKKRLATCTLTRVYLRATIPSRVSAIELSERRACVLCRQVCASTTRGSTEKICGSTGIVLGRRSTYSFLWLGLRVFLSDASSKSTCSKSFLHTEHRLLPESVWVWQVVRSPCLHSPPCQRL